MKNVYSVKQVNSYIKNLFTGDVFLSSLFVKGEISNLKYHSSGHIYFSLKDETSSIACVMFKGYRVNMPFKLENGDKIIACGNVDIYERDGKYQLYVKEVKKEGSGDLYKRFIELKNTLLEMGMFDESYKRPIKKYNLNIGVVTSPTGAAIRDIENIAKRRNPFVNIILYPALVQGESAKESIVHGIETLDTLGLDVIIVGRGGGSIEDLWAFNEECVARAIFECNTPIISAVGHETDVTISDMVADRRAPTPSAAAEIAVFDYNEYCENIEFYRISLKRGLGLRLNNCKTNYLNLYKKFEILKPQNKISERKQHLTEVEKNIARLIGNRVDNAKKNHLDILKRMDNGIADRCVKEERKLEVMIERFKGLSPLERLKQGFSYTVDEQGKNIRSVDDISEGAIVNIYMTDGKAEAEVKKICRI